MNCHIVQENLSAYLHGELTLSEIQQMHQHMAECSLCVQEEQALRRTQQALSQYQELSLPPDFDYVLTKKIHRIQKRKSISFVQVISSAAAAILLTLGIQYIIAVTDTGSLPAHYSLFQKTKTVVIQENSWADRMIDRFMNRVTKTSSEK